MKAHHKLMMKVMSGRAYEVPAYTNAGGTGDRTASITVTTTLNVAGAPSVLVNGITTATGDFFSLGDANVAGLVIQFDFVTPRLITEMRLHKDGNATGMGTWKCQRSTNGTDWTDIGGSFALNPDADTPQVYTELSVNTVGARYYRLLGVSGAMGIIEWFEFEFKIGNPL